MKLEYLGTATHTFPEYLDFDPDGAAPPNLFEVVVAPGFVDFKTPEEVHDSEDDDEGYEHSVVAFLVGIMRIFKGGLFIFFHSLSSFAFYVGAADWYRLHQIGYLF
jgi:hypothetical protein